MERYEKYYRQLFLISGEQQAIVKIALWHLELSETNVRSFARCLCKKTFGEHDSKFYTFFKAQHQPPFLKHTEKATISSVEVILRIFEPKLITNSSLGQMF